MPVSNGMKYTREIPDIWPSPMKPTIPQLRGEWLVLAAAVLWGTTGTAQALAPADAAPVTVGSMRLALGGIALLAIAVLRGTLKAGRPWPIRTLIAAAVCIAGYQVCFFSGVAATGVAAGTLVGIGSAPVVAGALDWLVEGVRPGRRWVGATGLAILGCTLLAFSSSGAVFQAWGDPAGSQRWRMLRGLYAFQQEAAGWSTARRSDGGCLLPGGSHARANPDAG